MTAVLLILAALSLIAAFYMVSDQMGWKGTLPDQKLRRAWVGIGLTVLSLGLTISGLVSWFLS